MTLPARLPWYKMTVYPGMIGAMIDVDRKRLLGQFVRAHRERLPAPAAGRRRTPGVRREELADRAGISATWLTWIEQGRDVQASADALRRLAEALDLTAAERAYLFDLAGRRDPRGPDPAPAEAPPPSLAETVAALGVPAYGLDRLWNATTWNAAAERLFPTWLGQGRQRNLLRYVFLDPAAKALIPDWDERARRLLAEFRIDYGRGLGDPRLRDLAEALRAESPAFAPAWEDQAVLAREGGERRFDHPLDGALRFRQHTFVPADRPDHKLVVLTPA